MGALAIAFANATSGPPSTRRPADDIGSPAALARWLATRGVLGEGVQSSLTPPELRRLHGEGQRLHGAVQALLTCVAGREAPESSTRLEINRILDATAWHRRFTGDATESSIVESLRPTALPGLLAPIALAAAEVAELAPGPRLRTCAAEDCSRWFLDTSKGGRRRWCSMATCGNRAKAARWRERQTSGG